MKNPYHKTCTMLLEYAEKAKQSKSGKYRGITEKRAMKLARHHAAIASGKIKPGTPCL
jgi:hypothetical protein